MEKVPDHAAPQRSMPMVLTDAIPLEGVKGGTARKYPK
jgi:hypothetical protein